MVHYTTKMGPAAQGLQKMFQDLEANERAPFCSMPLCRALRGGQGRVDMRCFQFCVPSEAVPLVEEENFPDTQGFFLSLSLSVLNNAAVGLRLLFLAITSELVRRI